MTSAYSSNQILITKKEPKSEARVSKFDWRDLGNVHKGCPIFGQVGISRKMGHNRTRQVGMSAKMGRPIYQPKKEKNHGRALA